MAVIVDQKRLGGGSYSTVGTNTDFYTLLRLLFSRIGKPHVGYSNAFSFNDPEGMCRECNGLGKKLSVEWDDFIDRSKARCRWRVNAGSHGRGRGFESRRPRHSFQKRCPDFDETIEDLFSLTFFVSFSLILVWPQYGLLPLWRLQAKTQSSGLV
jgi:excinuclease UvrABC ATPase subunit